MNPVLFLVNVAAAAINGYFIAIGQSFSPIAEFGLAAGVLGAFAAGIAHPADRARRNAN